MTRQKPSRRTDVVALPAKTLTVLLADVRELIVQARDGAARAVDAGLTTLYWHVGQRIRQDILKEKRAEYGEQIVSALSAQLEQEFGGGSARRTSPHDPVRRGLTRTGRLSYHCYDNWAGPTFLRLIPIEDPLKRDFYTEMCRVENWSTRTPQRLIVRWATSKRVAMTNRRRPWVEVVSLHPDVISENFSEDIFALDLGPLADGKPSKLQNGALEPLRESDLIK